VILDEVGPDTVVNPILWEKGIQGLVGVPLIHVGNVVGVMHAGRLDHHPFTDADAHLLQFAADRVAASLAVQQVQAEQAAARTLQRSLLPPRFPDVAGLEFAARFVPAEDFGVGGDWYDSFVLPSGRVGIVIGDVAGSGLQAAVVMGRIRSVLRAYAFESNGPADALDRLDRKFAHFEPGEMATVLYAVVEPSLDSVRMATAGHLPPVMATPERAARLLDIEPSPPIGAHLTDRRTDTVVPMAPGTAFGFYTDGLVERRGETIDRGLARLCAAFSAGPPDRVCGTVMATLTRDVAVEDDTALLTVRRVA
jgi:serine phosphatase RsbU (regulator of sigma subunit)